MNLVPAKVMTARLLASPPGAWVVGKLSGNQVRNHDLVFDTSHPAVTPRVAAQLFWRIYESSEIRMVRRCLGPTATIVDLGSSLGFTAAHAMRHLCPGGLLVAVEANEALLEPLRVTLNSHARGCRVEVVHAAVDYTGVPIVHLRVGTSSVASAVTEAGESGSAGQAVPTVTLGSLIRDFAIEQFTLLSDIEGVEAALISGDPAALRRCDQAVIELHDNELMPPEEMIRELGALGLDVSARHGNVVALRRR